MKASARTSAAMPPTMVLWNVTPKKKNLSPVLPMSPGISGMWGLPTQNSWRKITFHWKNIWIFSNAIPQIIP